MLRQHEQNSPACPYYNYELRTKMNNVRIWKAVNSCDILLKAECTTLAALFEQDRLALYELLDHPFEGQLLDRLQFERAIGC